ncbi:helix-turn-helix transcriptional regulator [Streptomyces aureus]
MTQLLMAQPSNYTPALLGEQPRVAPPAVRRAMEIIEGHAAEPLTVAEIAECAGVGVRALQEGFRRHLDTTPLAYLREVRLDRVRKELLTSDPGVTTVTAVASRWGFLHPGRFSSRTASSSGSLLRRRCGHRRPLLRASVALSLPGISARKVRLITKAWVLRLEDGLSFPSAVGAAGLRHLPAPSWPCGRDGLRGSYGRLHEASTPRGRCPGLRPLRYQLLRLPRGLRG